MKLSCLALVLALIGGTAAAQSTVDLTIDQARSVAMQALFADDPQLALQIAEAILAQMPDDRASLMIVAAAAPRIGDPERGRIAGARAWAVSTTDVQKYEAARLTALAAANGERYTLATLWLRRALTVAPNAAERTRTLNDARGITRLNPWSSTLSFSFAPSSNVNGGAEDADFLIAGRDTDFDIDADDLALSGWRASLGFGTQYRFHQDAQSRSTVALQYQGVRGKFQQDTDLPDATLSTNALATSLRYDRILQNGTASATLSGAVFQYYRYRSSNKETDRESYRTTGLQLDRTYNISRETSLNLSAGRERVDFTEDDGRIDRATIGVGLNHQFATRDRIALSARFVDAQGDNERNTSQDQTLSLAYSWAEPVGPVSLSAGASIALRVFPSFIEFDPSSISFIPIDGGRRDRTASAFVNIGFPQVSYAGFNPALRIDASRTQSNVSRYDRTTISAALTITSAF